MTMTESAPLVLLGGTTAIDLAPRLEASGYRTAPLPELGQLGHSDAQFPAAVILCPPLAERISDLRQRWGALPILLGCPRDDVEGRCLALASGADDLWLTSAGPSDLLTRLRLHLSLQQAARHDGATPLVVGDLQVDPLKTVVHRDGRLISLTAREFQLLLLLLRHSPMVVSREQILKEIWPNERAASSNVIEVYVRYLRRKLELGDLPRLIHTVRGLGYCLKKCG